MTTVISTITSTSAKPTTAKSSSSAAESAVPDARSEEGGEGKKFVECIYGGGNWTGSAMFSDGSYGPYPDCDAKRLENERKYPYVCPRTDHRVPDPSYCDQSNPFLKETPRRSSQRAAPAPKPAPEQEPGPAPVPGDTSTPQPSETSDPTPSYSQPAQEPAFEGDF